MAKRFTHLTGDSDNFPGIDNINVYKSNGDYQYSNYDYTQMVITLCNVPWDLGEARIGQRVISGIGNVVDFGSKEKRNAWFESIPESEKFVWDTKYRSWHDNEEIRIPLPFDRAASYNYIYVKYNVEPKPGSELPGESENYGWKEWFYVIREVIEESPNSTKCICIRDIWQTIIYDLNIKYMFLERGHAPVVNSDVSTYLKDPINNCSGLTEQDVNYGELTQIKNSKTAIINSGTQYALFITSSNPQSSIWLNSSATYPTTGSGYINNEVWETPGITYKNQDGTPQNLQCFAIATGNLSSFLTYCYTNYPSFFQTVQALYLVPSSLITLGTSFTFGNQTCYLVSHNGFQSIGSYSFSKSDFNYDSKYADLAKLYTYPYAGLEICTEDGILATLKIQDCTGTVSFEAALNNVFNGLKYIGKLSGIGGSISSSVSFNLLSSKSFSGSGDWAKYLVEWDIPTYQVTLQATQQAMVDNKFNYIHGENRADWEHDAANNTATANQTIANTSAAATKTCSNNNASNLTSNASLQASHNSTVNSANHSAQSTITSNTNWLSTYISDTANSVVGATASAQDEYNMATTSISNSAAMANAAVSAGTGVVATIASALTGDIGGAAASSLGAAGAIVSANISTAAATQSAAAAVELNAAHTYAVQTKNSVDAADTQSSNSAKLSAQQSAENTITSANNSLTTGTASNTASTINSNASTIYNAETANSQTRYNNETYVSQINNNIADDELINNFRQHGLEAPYMYGSALSTGSETVKPMGIWFNVITQNVDAIKKAGNAFLRYGYTYNDYWEFTGFNLMPKFTYWKISDLSIGAPGIGDSYVDFIRMLLFGGVTVWSDPSYIGNTSIYDNV